MKTLEILAKFGSFTEVAREYGAETFTIDNAFYPAIDLVTEIENIDISKIPFKPDILWARPSSAPFSVATLGKHWDEDNQPKTHDARIAVTQIKDILNLIDELEPKFWVIENRVGKLRKLNLIDEKYLGTVTFCQYSQENLEERPSMARTDLWTNFYDVWKPRPMCKNGDSCHISAPRGSSTGSQSSDISEKEKWQIPRQLSQEVLDVVAKHVG